MTARRGYAAAIATRGRRPAHECLRATHPLARLERLTRATYRGIPHVPDPAPIYDWRVCGCDWTDPLVNGRPVRQADNPRYQWSEEEADGKHSLAAEVRRLTLLYGLGYFHAKDAFRSFPGFPDATIWGAGVWLPPAARGERAIQLTGHTLGIVRELKPPTDTKFYGPQLATMTTMRHAGRDVGTWGSCCLLSGRISAELRQVAGGAPLHPQDHHGANAPDGRPAVSGTRYEAGTIPTEPDNDSDSDLMGDGNPMGAPSPATPRRATRPGAAAVLADLAASLVMGYVGNPQAPGLDQRAAADAVRQLARWASDWGVNVVWPWRMVVTADRYYVLNQARGWSEVSRLAGGTDVVALLERLDPRRVTAGNVADCQSLLAPARLPATQGKRS